MYWRQSDILLLFNITVFASSLCLMFTTDFTKGRCPLDPRRGDHFNVVITHSLTHSLTHALPGVVTWWRGDVVAW